MSWLGWLRRDQPRLVLSVPLQRTRRLSDAERAELAELDEWRYMRQDWYAAEWWVVEFSHDGGRSWRIINAAAVEFHGGNE